jgi:hypothetical protein
MSIRPGSKVGQGDALGAAGDRIALLADGGDLAVDDHDLGARGDLAGRDVDELVGGDDDGAGGGGGGEAGEQGGGAGQGGHGLLGARR